MPPANRPGKSRGKACVELSTAPNTTPITREVGGR